MGCLAQVSGIFRTSMAAETDEEVLSGKSGDISWQLVPEEPKDGWMLNGVTPYRLELSGTGNMPQKIILLKMMTGIQFHVSGQQHPGKYL